MRRIIVAVMIFAGCTARRPHPLSEHEAEALLGMRPEVKAFFERVNRLSEGSVHGMMMVEGRDDHDFIVYVGEDHDDHTALFQRYRVNRDTRVITAIDPLEENSN